MAISSGQEFLQSGSGCGQTRQLVSQKRPVQRRPQLAVHVGFGLLDVQLMTAGGSPLWEVIEAGGLVGQGGGWIVRVMLGFSGSEIMMGGGKKLDVSVMLASGVSVLVILTFHHSILSVTRGGSWIVVVIMVVL
jgi:hypothetical protein